MFQRLSLVKFILVTINTVIFNLRRGYFSISILVIMSISLILAKILKIRVSKNFRDQDIDHSSHLTVLVTSTLSFPALSFALIFIAFSPGDRGYR